MDEDLAVSEDFKKWFNKGYQFGQEFPQLKDQITTPKGGLNDKMKAFDAGLKQFEKDHGYDQKLKEREDLRSHYRIQQQSRGKGRAR